MRGMLPFYSFFPEVAEREVRVIRTQNNERAPDDLYMFTEFYCAEPKCDCRRVLFHVLGKDIGRVVASINHAFEPPKPGDTEEEQTFLDPLNPQSNCSEALLDLFHAVVLDDTYQRRLERHYAMVKKAVNDPAHPAQKMLADRDAAMAEPNVIPLRRSAPKIGANSLCPCGSGKKFKKCCARRATS